MAKKAAKKKAAARVAGRTSKAAVARPVARKPLASVRKVPPAPAPEPDLPPKKLKSPLSSNERKRFKKLLIALRERVSGQINFLADDALNVTKYDIPSDSGTDDFDRDFGLSLLSSEKDALFEIEDALRRIEKKHYGLCERCYKTIARSRLSALPFARLCINCQETEERGKFRFHPLGNTLSASTPPANEKEEEASDSDE